MKKLTWTKRPHPIWGKGGKEEDIHKLGLSVAFPKWQWLDKSGRFDIVGPASCLGGISDEEVYELYDRDSREVVVTYASLDEAKRAASDL